MRRFVLGFVSGAIVAGSTPALAATLTGRSGYLSGWDVVIRGDIICRDPWVWTSTREIDCD